MSKLNLTHKEIVELRLKALEPIIMTASKHGLEKSHVVELAEASWTYAIKPLVNPTGEDTAKAPSQ